ncbi:(2Fe-2S) ferredoxin domain-containing protein [Methylobacillus pratensis]
MKLLVCTKTRPSPNQDSCGHLGGEALFLKLQDALKSAQPPIEVEAVACMGMCSEGPNVHMIPIGKTWHHVNEQDIPEIVDFCKQA